MGGREKGRQRDEGMEGYKKDGKERQAWKDGETESKRERMNGGRKNEERNEWRMKERQW